MTTEEYDAEIARLEYDAEIARLRELVDFLEKAQQVTPADIVRVAALADENDRMRAAFRDVLAHLKAGTAFHMSACEWCGEAWPKCDDQPREVTEQVAREHLYACAKHPLRIECEHLRAEVRRLQQIIVDET